MTIYYAIYSIFLTAAVVGITLAFITVMFLLLFPKGRDRITSDIKSTF